MDDGQHFFKLDDLDSNYLFSRADSQNYTSLLWDNSKNRNEFKQFEIVVGRIGDGLNGAHASDENYLCRICNINVPTIYRREHNNSPKHRICLQITETALNRVKHHISLPDDNISINKNSESYFCEPCAIIVKRTDKKEHERSKSHYKSLLHDRFLNDLNMIYRDKNYLDTVNFEYLVKGDGCENNDLICDSDDSEELPFVSFSEVESEIGNETTTVKLENGVATNEKLRSYAETLKTNANDSTHIFHLISFDSLIVETLDKSVMKFSFDQFNGIKESPNAETKQCRLCQEIFTESKYEHILSPKHIEKVKLPLQDKHCFRQIDSTFKHCVLCNDLFFDLDSHMLLNAHREALEQATVDLFKRESSSVSKTNAVSKVNPKNGAVATSAFSLPKAKPTGNSGKTYCKYCDIFIDNHNFAAHESGMRHKTNMGQYLKQNDTIETDKKKEKTYCEFCKVFIDSHNFASHQKGGHHKSQMKQHKKQNDTNETAKPTETKKKGKTYCKFCKVYIDSHNFAGHEAGGYHKSQMKLETNKADTIETESEIETLHYHLQPSAQFTAVYCKVCRTKVPNTINNITDHVKGGYHKSTYEILLNHNGIHRKGERLYCSKCKEFIKSKKELDHIFVKHSVDSSH